ncbi:MAG TPA: FxSxx-COOH system tetratricopeptide repeat protein [Herpetosiphonaceae bacterium]
MQRSIKVFISYAHEDKKLRDNLDDHLANLKHQGIIETWYDGEIIAGQEWEPAILEQLDTADIILLLISAKFLASEYINSVEMKQAMQRHEAGEARVIPVLLRPVFFKDAPFARLEALPVDSRKQLRAITKWENRDEAYARVAEGIHRAVRLLQPEIPSDSPRSTAPLPSIWNVPHQRNPNFTGRETLLDQLQESLCSGQATALTQQAIHGLGGVGKTQLAVEYAYRHTADYDVVWWIRSEQTATLAADYAALAQKLNLAEKDATEQALVVEAVRRWLDHNSRWLLIFDNVTEPKDLDPYRPHGSGGQILITSRYAAWRAKVQPLEVEELDRAESIKFLLKRTGKTDEASANKLAESLGDLPLALEHAGAYVDATGIALSDYLELFENYQTQLFDESEPEDYPVSITKTWDLAFQQVQQSSPAAVDLLNLCAFLAPDDIPLDMIKEGAEFLPEVLKEAVQNPLALNKAIAALRRYSLIDRDDNMLSVHRMVQAVTRDRLSQEERERWVESAVRLVSRKFPFHSDDVLTWAECARLLQHALVAANYAETSAVAADATGRLLNQIGLYFQSRVQLIEAKATFERALRLNEVAYGPEHPNVGTNINNLGLVLQDLGKLTEAQTAFEQALRIHKAVYGPNHPQVAIYLSNLGDVLRALGNFTRAKTAHEQALRIDEVMYGPEHPDVAKDVNNLGGVLHDLGDLVGAKAAHERAVRIGEAVYGPEHPNVAIWVNNLGSVLRDLRELAAAKAAHERALRIGEAVYGPEHPHLATYINNLGLVLHDLGDFVGAKIAYEQAVRIGEAVYGPEHPVIAIRLNNLGLVLQLLGDLPTSKALLERALQIDEVVYGPEHLAVAKVVNNLGGTLRILGDLTGAKAAYERALRISRQFLGDEHPNTIIVRKNLAVVEQEIREANQGRQE